jgi:heme exporter protein A
MIEIELDKLERSFAERRVLRGISASLRGGDRLVVKGPNGSGKSTLLKVIAGLLTPTGGTIRFAEDGRKQDADSWRRRHLGSLAPDLVMYEDLTPVENLEFFARVRDLPRGEANRQLLARVGLEERRHDYVGNFSTGMKQRMKLAFALQNQPALLLLDEPGSNLDAPGRALIAGAVEEIAAREGIVIVATNDPDEFGYGKTFLELG